MQVCELLRGAVGEDLKKPLNFDERRRNDLWRSASLFAYYRTKIQ